MIKDCIHCCKPFETKRSSQKYCSYGCFVLDNSKQFPNPMFVIQHYKIAQDEINETIKRMKTAKRKGVFY